MRCYFDLVRDSKVIRDAEGVDVADPDNEHLKAEIAQAIRDVDGEDGPEGDCWHGWRLNAVTGEGTVLVSVALDEFCTVH